VKGNLERGIEALIQALRRVSEGRADPTAAEKEFDRTLQVAISATESETEEPITSFTQAIILAILWHRTERDWSQLELARRMTRRGYRWTRQSVADIESGRRRVSLEELFGLAMLFDFPVSGFLIPRGVRLKLNKSKTVSPETARRLLVGRR
jgi:hypothetical protein